MTTDGICVASVLSVVVGVLESVEGVFGDVTVDLDGVEEVLGHDVDEIVLVVLGGLWR